VRHPLRPILGTWTFTVPGRHCSETDEFRTNGTMLSSSSKARPERAYEITALPNAQGFYRLIDRVIQKTGRLDSFGEPTAPGVSVIIFIRFSPAATSFEACEAGPPHNCIGPLQRMRMNKA
jgi:hypothetical protein